MGMDVCRYIEVYTPDYDGYTYDSKTINNLGYFKIGDVFLVYNVNKGTHYFKLVDDTEGKFEYEPIVEPTDIGEATKFMSKINVVWKVEFYKDLPKENIILRKGMIYKYWGDGGNYLQYNGSEWVAIDNCPWSWKQIKWNENNYVASGMSYFIRNYIHNGWCSEGKLSARGLPKDITDDVKNSIYDTDFGFTYASLAEIENITNEAEEKLKNEIKNALNNKTLDGINDKLNIILATLKNESIVTKNTNEDDYEYDEFSETFDEAMSLVNSCNSEYTIINTIVDEIYGKYVSADKVRVIYSFNN